MKNQKFKSGFAAIIGMPNVGKSTLLNRIAGQKIAIISDKPQTTRNKILAVYTTGEEQIIFTDTPGIHKPHNKLGEYMVKVAKGSMQDTDVIIFVVDATRGIRETERKIAESINNLGLPCLLAINKVDAVKKEVLLPMIADYGSLCDFDEIVPISAKNGDGTELLLDKIGDYLNEGPQFFESDMVTDQPEKQIAAEIIREKMLWLLEKEIPHGIAISIEKMKETEKLVSIYANIYCEKTSHKGIIIGKGGEMLKKIASLARADIEDMLEKQVFLQLWVKVKPDWRNSGSMIKNFGFDEE